MAFSYFFRDMDVLRQAADFLMTMLPDEGPVEVWDAGCAFGQEPFSLAILLGERMNREQFERLRILATDIDISERFDRYISSGVYPWDDLKRIPHGLFVRWFEPGPREGTFQLKPPVRERVSYRRHDLTDLSPPACDFHMVLSKNTLMHFPVTQRNEVMAMFAGCLREKGLLALGQAQDYESVDMSAFERVAGSGLLFRKRQLVD